MMQTGHGSDLYRLIINSYTHSTVHDNTLYESSESAQERALLALRNHKEAEKRRRERINSHLDKLRSILRCNSKIDKASLLAKVVEQVRALKKEAEATSDSNSYCVVPTETDEVSVCYSSSDDGEGGLLFKASLCCEDRSDLMPELIRVLRSLRLRTVKAEMCSVGGRIRNVLIVAGDGDQHSIESVQFLQNALKGLVQRSGGSGSERSKRRRIVSVNKAVHQFVQVIE